MAGSATGCTLTAAASVSKPSRALGGQKLEPQERVKTALLRPQGGHGSSQTPGLWTPAPSSEASQHRWVPARGSSELSPFRPPASVPCRNPGLALPPFPPGSSPTLPSASLTPPGGPRVHLGSAEAAPEAASGPTGRRRPTRQPPSPPAPDRKCRLSPVLLRGRRRPALGSISL